MTMNTDGEKTKLKLEDIVKMSNVAVKLSEKELHDYGVQAVDGYNADNQTRAEWAERMSQALKLALQLKENKTFPFVGASNVKFPLVTIAALQFLARISTLTGGRALASVEAWGPDPDGKKAARAARKSQHMSYQLLEQNRNWVDDDEQAKFSAALLGCAVKKTYYDAVEGVMRSEYTPLDDFVVDYYCKDLERTQRATQRGLIFRNEIEENIRRGLYLPMVDDEVPPSGQVATDQAGHLGRTEDEIAGLRKQQQDNLRPYELLEQHTWLDLDGDGYCEPYTMIVRLDTKQVLRIVARYYDQGDVFRVKDMQIRDYEEKARAETSAAAASVLEKEAERLSKHPDNKIVRIVPTTHFTKYGFIPSPDGGFYGLGFGALLGPTNAAVDTLINQILDAGRMLTTNGGFLGRGVKLKAGKQSFDPFEWKPVDGGGDDLRKSIMPLPVNTPPDILFQLLGLLIQYGEKIGSATDAMTGVNPGQNTPAETSRNTLEQGMMLFSGIYKRMHRAFTEELRKLQRLNELYIKQSPDFASLTRGPGALFAPDDYDANTDRAYPAADSTAASPSQRQAKAKIAYDLMSHNPNGFDRYKVTYRVLEAYDTEAIDEIFPDPKGPNAVAPIPNPKVELEKGKLSLATQKHQDDMQLQIAELKMELPLNDAKIAELEAKAQKHIADAKGVDDGHVIELLNAQIGAAKAHREGLLKVLDVLERSHSATQTRNLKQPPTEVSNDGKA
jgi:chaperonin GroES